MAANSEFWPWWAGALGLAGVSVVNYLLLRRPLGASGIWSRVLHPRRERERAAAESLLPQDATALEAAWLAATVSEFGAEAVRAPAEPQPAADPARGPLPPPGQSYGVYLGVVVGLLLGGMLSAAGQGSLKLRLGLWPEFAALFGQGLSAWGLLFVAGLATGLGTRLAGGCTSGHGLSGCARLKPASLVATVIFFGTGIGVSLLLERWLLPGTAGPMVTP